MKKLFLVFCVFTVSARLQASVLEINYVKLLNAKGKSVRHEVVHSGDKLILEMQYTRQDYPEDSKILIDVEIYDASGKVALRDQAERPHSNGTRLDQYHFQVPHAASGKFLIVLTIQVLAKGSPISGSPRKGSPISGSSINSDSPDRGSPRKEELISEVSKNIPFDVL